MIDRIKVRKEEKKDYAKVRMINQFAFPTDAEADLVERVRSELDSYFSLVAEYESHVVGHILFTPVTITENKNNFKWCGLAPMAVEPSLQGRGIGSKLVERGLQIVANEGYEGVVVLGHPEYYPRFGFQPAHLWNIQTNYDVPDEAFMVRELTNGVLESCSGLVTYNQLFQEL